MNAQEMYEGVRAWFSRDGAQFAYVVEQDGGTGGFQCLYRGDGNPESQVRCGIGCQIPDRMYEPSMEGNSITDLLGATEEDEDANEIGLRWPEISTLFEGVPSDFLDEIQNVHDTIAQNVSVDSLTHQEGLEQFLNELDKLAARCALQVVTS